MRNVTNRLLRPRRPTDLRAAPRARKGCARERRTLILVYALNFYSPIVASLLRSYRKTCTIRLGDKSAKYKKGMVVHVLVGARYSPRDKIFDAVIDKVDVKRLGDLSPREIEHDNPELRRVEDMATCLGQIYNREVTEDEIVTVIRFSAIKGPFDL